MYLNDLIKRNRRRPARAQCLDERGRADALAFILPPQIHLLESRPAEPAQPAEVVQLQHAPGGENLQSLLRKRLAAVREVVDRTDGAVGEAELQGDRIAGCRIHGGLRIAADRYARQKPQQDR